MPKPKKQKYTVLQSRNNWRKCAMLQQHDIRTMRPIVTAALAYYKDDQDTGSNDLNKAIRDYLKETKSHE